MRVRNVGKTGRFPAWGGWFAATASPLRDKEGVFPAVQATPAINGKQASKGRLLPFASLPVTALLAALGGIALVGGAAYAQDETPAPAPQVPAPDAPTPTPQNGAPTPGTDPTTSVPNPNALAVIPKGRIRVFVKDGVTGEILADAAVFLDDPTKTDLRSIPYYIGDAVRVDDENRPLGGEGYVITDLVAVHDWYVVAIKEGYDTGRAVVTVKPDQTVDVTVYLKLRERIFPFILLSTRDTSNNTRRILPFVRTIPVETNRQSITDVIASAPGFVKNSLGQSHPRGQRFGIAQYLDGFLLPNNPTGLLHSGTVPQDVVAQYDIRNGGLSAEYGGDVGVAVDLTTRRPSAIPFIDAMLTSGGLGTDELYVTFGQRFPLRGGSRAADAAREQELINLATYGTDGGIGGSRPVVGSVTGTVPTFGYTFHVSQRNTNVVTDAPQRKQTLNNTGFNNAIFGKVEFIPGPLFQINALVNYNGGRAGIANRDRAGGVGFTGQTNGIGSGGQQLVTSLETLSQDQLSQRQYQKESNSLALVSIRRVLRPRDTPTNPDSSITLSVGGSENDLRLENENRNFDPRDLTNPNSPLYRANSSIEFNPTIRRFYDQSQSQIDVVLARDTHIVKGGVLLNGFSSDERYQFEPGSQIALNALFAKSPLLVPFSAVPDQTGARDFLGNQFVNYQSVGGNSPGVTIDRTAPAPGGRIRREGEYSAAYLQDTWSFNPVFTINSGLRVDNYALSAVGGNNGAGVPGMTKTDTGTISPRLNFAYELPRKGFLGFLGGRGTRRAVLRAGYNRLFQRPPLGQGTYFGTSPIRPQTADSWELGLEKQLGSSQTLKGTVYATDFQNYLDVEGLFPGTQFATGALVLVNYPRARSEGFELTYNYNPTFRHINPMTFFATYTNSGTKILARRRSFDSLGRLVTKERPDMDQLHTLNFGFSYRLRGNSSVGFSSYLGSGLFGSQKPGSRDRDSVAEINLRFSTSPRLFKNTFGLDVSVENLFDQRNQYNFYTDYEGIRVQTGRRILTSVYARF